MMQSEANNHKGFIGAVAVDGASKSNKKAKATGKAAASNMNQAWRYIFRQGA